MSSMKILDRLLPGKKDSVSPERIESIEEELEKLKENQRKVSETDQEIHDTIQGIQEDLDKAMHKENKKRINSLEEKIKDLMNTDVEEKVFSSLKQLDTRADKIEEDRIQPLEEEIREKDNEIQELRNRIDDLEASFARETQELRKQISQDYRELSKEIGKSHTLNKDNNGGNITGDHQDPETTATNSSSNDKESQSATPSISEISQNPELKVKQKMKQIIIKLVDEGKPKKEIKRKILEDLGLGSTTYFYQAWNNLEEKAYIQDGNLMINKKAALKEVEN